MLTRRAFMAAAGSAAASPRDAVQPYFPTAAHQLVWRNWDLAPASRIAEALGCAPAKVAELARSMGLGRQPDTQAFRSRMQFQLLRRNWDFVPYTQLTRLLGRSEAEIDELLSQDAFYVHHLGPKPECRAIRAGETSGALLPRFRFASSGKVESRFGFIERVSRPVPPGPWAKAAGETALSPRIVFPYCALYGDVLKEEDFESYYPSGLLQNLAVEGLSAIWLHAVLRDLLKSAVFPDFGTRSAVRLRRLNWLIREARKHGLGVYLYLNEPRGMPQAFFARYPEVKGAPGREGDGLSSLCTSTEPVKRYLRESAAALFREAPGLEGAFLITASENTTNCYSLARRTECPRCSRRRGPEVIGEVVRLIEEGARSVKRDAHIIAWDWSWGVIEDDPQEEIIRALPRSVTLMVDFERGQPIERAGVRTVVDEYSLSVSGPSPRAAAHIRQGRERGMKVMAKVQVGNTWELSLLPYIPVPELVARKFQALRMSGVSGAVESWTLGGCPSVNWQVAQAYYRGDAPDPAEASRRAAHSPSEADAYGIFSNVFSRYPFSNSLVYSSVVQCGPAHPVWLEPSGREPKILNSYDNLGWTKPYGPHSVADQFARMADEWRAGLAHTRDAIAEAVYLYFRSISNQVRIHALRGESNARLKELVRDELRVAERFLSICEADSRVGFEASLQYFYLPLDIREKIVACRYMLEQRL